MNMHLERLRGNADDFYSEDFVTDMLENDQLNSAEEGFMSGYLSS